MYSQHTFERRLVLIGIWFGFSPNLIKYKDELIKKGLRFYSVLRSNVDVHIFNICKLSITASLLRNSKLLDPAYYNRHFFLNVYDICLYLFPFIMGLKRFSDLFCNFILQSIFIFNCMISGVLLMFSVFVQGLNLNFISMIENFRKWLES